MKYSTFIIIMLLLINCKQQKIESIAIDKQSVDKKIIPTWLIGSWERMGESEGKQTYEYWEQNAENEFVGMGCTLKGNDTIWKENILLIDKGDGWDFQVTGMGDSVSTDFKITSITESSFTFENDQNEFPKKIKYTFNGEGINAVISGGGPTIPFDFKRMK